ncbi:MAG: Hsp20/alpha crystallin family protein [Blastocatellia bacterium]
MMREPNSTSLFFLSADPYAKPAWRPSADICRTREGWVVKLDLAGVHPEDVTVKAGGSQIVVTGVRHDRIFEEGWSIYEMEIAYHRFERTIELPCNLDRASVSVECREGLLLLRVTVNE